MDANSLLKTLRPHVPHLPAICWIGNGDAGPDYCRDCAENVCAEHNAMHPHDLWFADGGWEERRESDGLATCEECGATLSYSLTRFGLESEIAHYRRHPIKSTIVSETAFEVEAILSAAVEHGDKRLLRSAIAIGLRAIVHLPTASAESAL